MPGGPFVKGDPRINRKGRPPGVSTLVKAVLEAVGEDRRKFGAIIARALLSGKLRFPNKRDSLTLSADQYIKLALHFCPMGNVQGLAQDAEEQVVERVRRVALGGGGVDAG